MAEGKEIRLRVGRGTQVGYISLSTFLLEVLSLNVSYKGERAATVVLTGEQVRQLREALDQIAPQVEAQRGGLRLVA